MFNEKDKMLSEVSKKKSAFKLDAGKILKSAEEMGFGPKSLSLLKKALAVESLGSMPFSMYRAPPIIEKAGEGAVIYDVDGKEYIDMIAGFSVNNIGYHRREVLEAIVEQYSKISQYAEMLSEVRIKLSELLVRITPGDYPKKVFYGVTGTDANEITLKLVRFYTGRPYVMTHWADYHGRTSTISSLTSSFSTWAQTYPVPPTDPAIIRFPFPYCYRCPFKLDRDTCDLTCVRHVEYMLKAPYYGLSNPRKNLTNVAAFLIEPFQSAAGYIIPPEEYLPALYKIAKERDILFVVDEIQTGWARTGKLWAVDHYPEVKPDIILVSKSMAGGIPCSAVVGKSEIMDSWGPGAFSTTFAGYMLAAASALKTINILLEEDFASQAREKGKYFLKGLMDLKERHPIIGDIQVKGLYIGIEFVKNHRDKKPATEETAWMASRLLELGMLVKKSGYFGNRFAMSPPLNITYEQIDKAVEILDKAFTEAEQKFGIKKE
ncbi:MAG TPA: aspartate aminotransferase family protein [Nitrososphaeria archaeon]|nr:aspartate aminotransferase family protein [Nitrososphaeria archaeon]